jgi:hypothetical protein
MTRLVVDYQRIGGSIPSEDRDLSLFYIVQTGYGAHLTSISMGTRRFFPGIKHPGREAGIYKLYFYSHPFIQLVPGAVSLEVKRQGREADHSPPSSAEVKNGGAIPPLPLRLHGVVLN